MIARGNMVGMEIVAAAGNTVFTASGSPSCPA